MDVSIRRSKRAKRMAIRVGAMGVVELVLPQRASEKAGLAFLQERHAWITSVLGKQQQAHEAFQPIVLEGGALLPCFGDTLTLAITSDATRVRSFVRETSGTLHVHISNLTQLEPAVTRFSIAQGKQYFEGQAHEFAETLHTDIGHIRVLDMKTQWGSCNKQTKTLAFNWRLSLAPEHIARYVVAHEIAHLVHANHSEKFWNTVGRLDPSYATSRAWLKMYGGMLHLKQKLSRL